MHCCRQHSHFDSIFKWLLFMGLKTRLKNVNLKRIQPKDLLNGDHQKRYSHILHFIIQNNYEKYFIKTRLYFKYAKDMILSQLVAWSKIYC